jgi:pyruvate dehydrogenase E1 component alpha subunit
MSLRLLSRSLPRPRPRLFSPRTLHPLQPPLRSLPQLALRSVTTDATASHTDPSKIPEDGDEHFTINLHPDAFETYNLDPLSLEMDVTKNELVKMYREMVVIRRLEMASDALYKAKKIRGL